MSGGVGGAKGEGGLFITNPGRDMRKRPSGFDDALGPRSAYSTSQPLAARGWLRVRWENAKK